MAPSWLAHAVPTRGPTSPSTASRRCWRPGALAWTVRTGEGCLDADSCGPCYRAYRRARMSADPSAGFWTLSEEHRMKLLKWLALSAVVCLAPLTALAGTPFEDDIAVVPEPTGALLMGAALVIVALVQRARR